jgi:large subunit ribosomal protein L13
LQKTYYPSSADAEREWILVDANDQVLGRLASQIASILLGKHKPQFTPGVDMGDYVVVTNASHIRVTGKKMADKYYYKHSGYPSGLKTISLRDQLETHPDRVVKSAVWGMLPHNKLGRKLINHVKIYGGPTHPHEAQNPRSLPELTKG